MQFTSLENVELLSEIEVGGLIRTYPQVFGRRASKYNILALHMKRVRRRGRGLQDGNVRRRSV
jgi:hypothetical protein